MPSLSNPGKMLFKGPATYRYGPLEGYIEKTWVMNNFELIK